MNRKPVQIDKSTAVIIPVYGIHHDEKNFPNPENFDPERFNDENVNNIARYTFLPFGEGPRICLGIKT